MAADSNPNPPDADRLRLDDAHGLTRDERQVLDMALAGLPNKTIARRVGVAMRTVERRRAAALRRIGAETLVEAAARMASTGTQLGTFEAVFAVTGPAAVIDRERLVAVNAALCNLFGLTRVELIGRPFSELTHPEDAAAEFERVARLFAGEIDGYVAEKRLTIDGRTLHVFFAVSPVRCEEGATRFALVQFLRGSGAAESPSSREAV